MFEHSPDVGVRVLCDMSTQIRASRIETSPVSVVRPQRIEEAPVQERSGSCRWNPEEWEMVAREISRLSLAKISKSDLLRQGQLPLPSERRRCVKNTSITRLLSRILRRGLDHGLVFGPAAKAHRAKSQP